MRNRLTALARRGLLLLAFALALCSSARADMGPKASLRVTVVNAPAGTVYLDLLTRSEPSSRPHANLQQEDEAALDQAVLANLRSLEGEGWVLAYATGADHAAPVRGDVRPGADGTWHFGYHGLPGTFRVAAATAQGAQAAAQPYTRRFTDSIVYDWAANTVRPVLPTPVYFLRQLLITLLPTLLVEGLILRGFGFSDKRTWRVFWGMNLATQLGLHMVCGSSLLILSGAHPLFYVLIMLVPELAICGAELLAFALLAREGRVRRRVGYVLCANLASFAAGYIPAFLLMLVSLLA